MQRVSVQDLVLATRGRPRGVDLGVFVDRVSIDSREVRSGDVFWALQGETHDGHNFTTEALNRDASLCVISETHAESITGPALIVDDTLGALGRFADWYRGQTDSLVIGVTGSVGKTTTRELIYSALSSQFPGIRSRSNFNNEIGLPLTLLEMDPLHEFAVVEMGASRRGDIRRLCEIARPEIGVVTAIGSAHMRTFGSLNAIIETKGELLENLPSTGFAVLPGDDRILRQMADRATCPVIFVGQSDDCHLQATDIEVHTRSLRFRCVGEAFSVPVTGRHSLSNALCAIAVGLEIGIHPHLLATGLSHFEPVPGRCGIIQIGQWTVVDDTYNASPLAVQAACRLLQELVIPGSSQRFLILGDMCELGDLAVVEHEAIGRLVAWLQLDRLLVCGNHADDVARGAARSGMNPHQIVATSNIETLLAMLDCWLEPNVVLLVKGSRATRMERVIEWLKVRSLADDRWDQFERRRNCA
jgi:UDP-N-acetylmuramoyl-tripeptide--D-alanyl-D-alanine ligase